MFGLSTKHFGRYREIGLLLYKYGRADLVRESGLLERVGNIDEPTAESSRPEELASDLERLGPAYVKLGQMLSTRPDFLPEPYLDSLARLQDNAQPVEWSEIVETLTEELGAAPDTVFAEFDQQPLATASIGQVHRATTHDGRQVVVKIQRPHIEEQLAADVAAFGDLAAFLEQHVQFARDYQLVRLVDSLQTSLKRELNYVEEAHNALQLKKNLSDHERIVVPEPIIDLTSRRVLTMEYVRGAKVTDLSGSVLVELDRQAIANDIFSAYLHQVLIDGCFHADPHPGNLSLTADRRIALLDFGLVVRVSPRMRTELIKLMLALAENDARAAARIAENIGDPSGEFEATQFQRELSRIVTGSADSTMQQLSVGRILMQIQAIAGRNQLSLPDEVLLLGKTMMNLDRVLLVLAPDFSPHAAIRAHASEILARHGEAKISPSTIYRTMLESAEFAQELPRRANQLLKLASENQLEVKVHSVDENKLIQGVHKVANRITAGVIVAALIIGASLIMRLETSWQIGGYPALATLFFLMSAGMGACLVWKATFGDDV